MTPWKRKEQIGDATLYLGDCLEVLPHIGKVDAVVTDPPYGINTKSDGMGKLNGRGVVDRGLADVQRFKWSSMKPNGHPAEKPERLCRWLIDAVGAESVCDPFMGSGTTGAVSAASGRRFVGIELDGAWFDIACERISMAYAQGKLDLGEPA